MFSGGFHGSSGDSSGSLEGSGGHKEVAKVM